MPQALKPLSLIHIGRGKFSQLPLLALWGNKNWLPSMKWKKLKIFQNKSGLKGCKGSSLNAPGTEASQFHPNKKLQKFPILIILVLWGNKNWLPSMKVRKFENVQSETGLRGCKWSNLNPPGTETPLSHPYWKLQEFPFSHY